GCGEPGTKASSSAGPRSPPISRPRSKPRCAGRIAQACARPPRSTASARTRATHQSRAAVITRRPILDQAHRLKLELPREPASLRDPPPAPSKHLPWCLRNRVQAKPIILSLRILLRGEYPLRLTLVLQ